MSKSSLPESIKLILWGKSAGRCQYEGCNKPLWKDNLTKNEFNIAYHAHIIGDSKKGPRGDKELSSKLCQDISNIMLLCDEHHRLIDKKDVTGHPAERLKEMKSKHEIRIQRVTEITEEKQSHVILYAANIGKQNPYIDWNKAACAMLPNWYPAEDRAIELSLKCSSFRDNWEIEKLHLEQQYCELLKPRLINGINHFSIFGFAPQPLLILLGKLLSDIPSAEVYQLHREPQTWVWQDSPKDFKYIIHKPEKIHSKVALNLSLSATIDNSRITSVLGEDVSIWSMTIAAPYNDFLKGREQLSLFREEFKRLLDLIKSIHGENAVINVFPSVPVAVGVEIGRIWMPKADLPLRLYDEINKNKGFVYTFNIE